MKPILTLLCTILALFGHGQNAPAEYIENKGQWDSRVLFKTPLRNGAVFLHKDGITVVQHSSEDLEHILHQQHNEPAAGDASLLRSHAFRSSFLHSNVPVISIEDLREGHYNFFSGSDTASWASGCRASGAVVYKNIYNGIDIRYYTSAAGLKYDFIVHPHADPAGIAMAYEGLESLRLIDGDLVLGTSVGDLKESIPLAYTIGNGVRTPVSCDYVVEGNTVKFKMGPYASNETLVIDPQLVFSTFSGSTADNWGNTATYGSDGSLFAAGIVFGTGFPVNAGAYQTTFQGGIADANGTGYDIAIMKFNATGTSRVYATYLGGSGNEIPSSLIADGMDNLVITGRTNSPNYPSTATTIGPGGNYDLFITKLNITGTALIGSRRIGGTGIDGVNITANNTGATSIMRSYGDFNRGEVALDAAGNIVFVGATQSADFPASAGTFQTALSGSRMQHC